MPYLTVLSLAWVWHGSHLANVKDVAELHFFLEALEEGLCPCSFWVLAVFSSLQWEDRDPLFFTGCRLKTVPSF